MKATEPAPLILSFAERIVALHPAARVELCALSERGRTQADWIVGIKAFSDGASVHADHWERHPRGDEVLCLLDGQVRVTLGQGRACAQQTTVLVAGQMLLVPQGHWHRLTVEQPGRLLFITPSAGSEHQRLAANGEVPL